MIITLKQNAATAEVSRLRSELEEKGFIIHPVEGARYNILGLIGDTASLDARQIESLDFVDKVTRIQEPPEQVLETAKACKEAGATILRGGAFKPRTSPYSFQGMGPEGLELLELAKKETGLPIVSEVMDISQLQYFDNVDMLQIGARNMQNFTLLKEVGKLNKPVLLKRGLSATYEEWLMAAEYIMSEGNEQVVLCERGIRTFETKTRNTLDVTAIPMMHELSHLPIIMDPSHAAGMSRMVRPLSLASVGGGADGLMIEVHNDPSKALCDGPQALRPDQFTSLMKEIIALRQALVECTK